MRTKPLPLLALILAFPALSGWMVAAPIQPRTVDDGPKPKHGGGAVSGVIGPADIHLVEFDDDFVPDGFEAAVAAAGGQVQALLPAVGMATVRGLDDAAADGLLSVNGIKFVTRDYRVHFLPEVKFSTVLGLTLHAENLPPQNAAYFNRFQWNMRQIQAVEAWNAGFLGDSSVTVAVLDTGIDPNHMDLTGRVDLSRSVSFVPGENILDLNFHGTFVSGLISSNNRGTAGVAPLIQLVAVKVLDRNGEGLFSWIIAGLYHAAHLDVDVINMSLGAFFPKSLPGAGQLVGAMSKAVNHAGTHGALVVASAGNAGVNLDRDFNFTHIPSQCGNAFSISATGPIRQTNFDRLASYSNFGRSGVDIAAPGGESLYVGGTVQEDATFSLCSSAAFPAPFPYGCGGGTTYVISWGTSYAVPIVSGIAALVDSRFGGNLNAGQLRTILKESADDVGAPGNDLFYSHGRVNAYAAVQMEP